MNKPIEVYRRFQIETAKFDMPCQFGYTWFLSALDKLWEHQESGPNILTDWLGFEQFSRDVLDSQHLTDEQRVQILREAVGAFTGRGQVQVGVVPFVENRKSVYANTKRDY